MFHFRVYPAGNILSWTKGTWYELMGKTEICSVEEQKPREMSMQEGHNFCEKFRGNMTVIKDVKMWEDLNATIIPPYGVVWTGFSEDSKGQFVDIVSGTQVLHEQIDESLGGKCLAISQSTSYVTLPCEWTLVPFICRLPKIARFQMRGWYYTSTCSS